MKIKIYTTTKNKNKSQTFHIDMINEYVKRLSKYAKCEVVFGKKLNKVSKNTKVFLLDASKTSNSEYLAEMLNTLTVVGFSEVVFLTDISLLDIADVKYDSFSVSTMNFTELTAVSVLLEQIYRGYKILNNENYHK